MSYNSFVSLILSKTFPVYHEDFYVPKVDEMFQEISELEIFMNYTSWKKTHFIIGNDLVKIVYQYWNPLVAATIQYQNFRCFHPNIYFRHHRQLSSILPTLACYPTALEKFQFMNSMVRYRKVSDKSFLLAPWYVQKRKEHWAKKIDEFGTFCDVLEEYLFDENSDSENCEEVVDWSDLLEGVKHEIILNSEDE